MEQKGLSPIFAAQMPMVLFTISVCCSLACHPANPPSVQKQGTSHLTTQAADASSAGQGEGCKLQPYKGTVPLPQVQYYSPGEEDVRGGMICTFRINSNLPLFAFHFAGKEDNTFGNIQITEGTGGKVIQTIENTTDPHAIAPKNSADLLTVVDANFDGYQDLQLLIFCGAKTCSYNFYLYDPKTNQFVPNNFLSGLSSPVVDPAKKQVSQGWLLSAYEAGGETYQYEDTGRYVLIRREASTWDRDAHTVTHSTYELRNGQMQLVNSTTEPE